MMTKIYVSLWAVLVLVFMAFFVTGNLTQVPLIVFGFLSFGMVFMGIIGVLPTAVHDSHVRH